MGAALRVLGGAAWRGFLVGGVVSVVTGIGIAVQVLAVLHRSEWWAVVLAVVISVVESSGFWVVAAVGIALAAGLPLALLDLVTRPLPVDRIPDPDTVLRLDRRWSLARAGLFGAVVGVGLLPTALAVVGLSVIVSSGRDALPPGADLWQAPPPAAVVVTGAVTALGMLLTSTAWGRFAFARAWLALRGRVPWRLMTFLAEARDRGVLRRVGAGYAFRHERLRDHLADGPAARSGVPSCSGEADPASVRT